MSEVSDIAIKRTQDSLGKVIKKPVLTEKLLRKPPFKFLHDIIHAVIKTTGFLDGLYTEDELQSDNIKDRDSKIAFLQKTIDALKLATKQEVKARPSKIVAGLEADKTNELLVAIAKAIDRKIDTTDAVARVKNGTMKTETKKESIKTGKTETRKAKKDGKEIKDTGTTKKVKSTASVEKPSKKTESKLSKQSSKDSIDSRTAKLRSSSQQRDKEKEKEKERKKEREKTATLKTESPPKVKPEIMAEPKIEAPHVNGNVNGVIENHENQGLKPNVPKIESTDSIVKEIDLPKVVDEVREKSAEKTPKTTPEKKVEENVEEKPAEKQSQKSATSFDATKSGESESIEPPPQTAVVPEKVEKLPNDKPRSSKLKKSHSKNDADKISENAKLTEENTGKFTSSKSVDKLIERPLATATTKTNDINKQSKPPRTALRSAAVRPISARPSAPRRRDRNVRQIIHTESFIQDTAEQKAEKKNAIQDFDDADNIVITETIPDNISTMDESGTSHVDADIDGTKQGHLVQQILETQTAILKSDAKNDISAITDDRKSITRNMTELRKMIQKLSLCITPLGKMMEYFQEDVDAMQIELMMWQKAGAAAEADIKEEQRTTEKLLESFKYQLAEINNSIKDHAEQINNTTMNIIQNEEKISKLISTLT